MSAATQNLKESIVSPAEFRNESKLSKEKKTLNLREVETAKPNNKAFPIRNSQNLTHASMA